MKLNFTSKKDFYAGLLFIFIGAVYLYFTRDHAMGTARQMGPGYFPTVLSWMLIMFGVFVAAMSVRVDAPDVGSISLRPLLYVIGSLVVFGLVVERLGLLVAVLGLVVVSVLADRDWNPVRMVVLFAVLSAFAVGLFVFGFGLTHRILPPGMVF